MVELMDRAKKLVDSQSVIDQAKARKNLRNRVAGEAAAIAAQREASRELEATRLKVEAGEIHDGAMRLKQAAYEVATAKVQGIKRARTELRDTAPEELRIQYLRKKRELVSVQTRINLLDRQQIPDAELELKRLREAAAALANRAAVRDRETQAQIDAESRQSARDIAGRQRELDELKDEHQAAELKLAALKTELDAIDRQILEA